MSEATSYPNGFIGAEYVCHKRVRAAKITGMDAEPGAAVLKFDGAPSWPVSKEWFDKHDPEVGGYLVFYTDGYVSYSPAKAFEEGYTLV